MSMAHLSLRELAAASDVSDAEVMTSIKLLLDRGYMKIYFDEAKKLPIKSVSLNFAMLDEPLWLDVNSKYVRVI